MTSVVSGGTTDRIVARTRFRVLRAGSGTPARYSSTLCGALPFEPGSLEVAFFIPTVRAHAWAPTLHPAPAGQPPRCALAGHASAAPQLPHTDPAARRRAATTA